MATKAVKPKQPEKRGKKAAEPAMPAGGPWMTRAEAARYIGVALRTLDGWRDSRDPRRPASYKIGAKVLYKQADLDTWLEKQREVV